MATRTGRMVVDGRSGKMVEEIKEDQMLVALYDPALDKPSDYTFQRVLRSNFILKRINELFNCNAALLKDPFGNVLWPKDWLTQVLPPSGKDKWFYIIHERLEPPPQDDLQDPMYTGGAVVVLTHVPKECELVDVRTWLLFGISQEYAPLERVREQLQDAEKKRALLQQKLSALPSMDAGGSAEQQAEMRKMLADSMASYAAKYDDELKALEKKRARIEKFLHTEPLELTALAIDKPLELAANVTDESLDEYEKRVETRRWVVKFTGSRGQELASVALAKSDWNYICLVQTRPQPKAFIEDDQVQNQVISEKDLAKEINMRLVRPKRLRHGTGELLQLQHGSKDTMTDEEPLKPWDEEFHISSIGAMYAGEWRLGEKHGYGKEATNVGIYEGEFKHNFREGRGRLVYGKGFTTVGTFGRRTRGYEYSTKCRERRYAPSLLNGDDYRDGVEHGEHMTVNFPDGAIYQGEMTDGRITGYGSYTSSTGVMDDGFFQDGLLHGEHCSRRFPDGTRLTGRFERGQLHGRGALHERNGDQYDGFFEMGVKSGRGTSLFDKKRCKHVGFWSENTLNGRGECFIRASDEGGSAEASGPTHKQSEDEHEEDKWDFWYEGSFVRGETQARHRFVDLKKQRRQQHLPFTTNGKSESKMPYLTLTLPQKLAKLEARRFKNTARRADREKLYLQKQEFANLSLYYGLLDEYYEKWVQKQRERKEDEQLDSEALEQIRQERAAAIEFAENRLKFRKEIYDLSSRIKHMAEFETYLERVTLTERVQLDRATAWEPSAATTVMEKAATTV